MVGRRVDLRGVARRALARGHRGGVERAGGPGVPGARRGAALRGGAAAGLRHVRARQWRVMIRGGIGMDARANV